MPGGLRGGMTASASDRLPRLQYAGAFGVVRSDTKTDRKKMSQQERQLHSTFGVANDDVSSLPAFRLFAASAEENPGRGFLKITAGALGGHLAGIISAIERKPSRLHQDASRCDDRRWIES
jgi:hypothetical protein